MPAPKTSDPWSILVIVLTFALFAIALFVNGFTHDVLLEAGVFLVSVKLILMAKKNAENDGRIESQLAEIKEMLHRREASPQTVRQSHCNVLYRRNRGILPSPES